MYLLKNYLMKKSILHGCIILLTGLLSCDKEYLDPGSVSTSLNGIKVSTWMYQIQNLEDEANIDRLAATEYDMLVVEPGQNFTEEPYNTAYLTQKLSQKPDGTERILLAYIDIGQAEDYRNYWGSDWTAPTADLPGNPDFLITIDPDGWSGNYPVAYWDPRWQQLWLDDNGIIAELVRFGFTGVYLDWVEAYDETKVRERAHTEGINTELEMMKFIDEIRKKGKSIDTGFLVVSQNAPYLLDADPVYYTSLIDALATEDTWYYGLGDSDWDDDDAGDLTGGERQADDYSTENRIAQNKKYLDLGIPVFTIDYCISEKNAKKVYKDSRKNGFIPLVSRVSLSEITETPPF